MARRSFPWRLRALIVAAFVACLLFSMTFVPAAHSTKPDENVYDYRAAAQMMNQIGDALVARDQKRVLDAFDLDKMNDGPLFRQQISSFFANTGNIRVHFNLAEATMENGKGVARVDAEMEAGLRDENLPPVHKQAQLRFVAEKSGDGWKFTDVEPRTFFSTTQP